MHSDFSEYKYNQFYHFANKKTDVFTAAIQQLQHKFNLLLFYLNLFYYIVYNSNKPPTYYSPPTKTYFL